MNKATILCVVLLFFLITEGFSQVSFSITDATKITNISSSVASCEDFTQQMTFRQIQNSGVFKASGKDYINVGYRKNPVWFRFTLANATQENILLSLDRTLSEDIILYYPDNKGNYQYKIVSQMSITRFREYRFPHLVFSLPKLSLTPQTYYLQIRTPYSLYFKVETGTQKVLTEQLYFTEIGTLIFFGILIATLFFNFIIYYSLQNASLIYYTLYLVSIGLYLFYFKGFGGIYLQHIELAFSYLGEISGHLSIVFASLFTYYFLRLKIYYPLLKYFVGAMVIVHLLEIGLLWFGFKQLSLQILNITSFLIIAYPVIALLVYVKGYKPARFFFLGWTFLTLANMWQFLVRMGLMPYFDFTSQLLPVGVIIEILFINLAIVDNIYLLRKKNDRIQAENLHILQEQNEIAEHKVAQRTATLREKNQELATQNEEIKYQQEEIKTLNENLENEVKLRTQELVSTNRDLTEKNRQLEQYAFVTSHIVRSPVARILGLGIVLDMIENREEEKMVVQKMIDSARELDTIIYDLSIVLEVRKKVTHLFKKTKLTNIVQIVSDKLAESIQQNQVNLTYTCKGSDAFYTYPPYLENMLEHLVSNAIKYRHANRTPEINISFRQTPTKIILTITDNGLGIDLEKYGGQLFGLYKRFHLHMPGKGLGLYLVKTQVTAMEGRIEVASEPEIGSVFKITFRKSKS
ncbi:MAG: sensor histidine kinase [Verrucomicrobia bacterium]|nr:sensor histidine kinase [Cytophagales bacterium]